METEVRCAQCSARFPAHVVQQFGGMCPACVAGFAEVPDRTTLKPGTTFGRYEILDVLGRGGMGVVYRARQADLDRVVALKVLSERLSSDPEFVQRFTREAKTLAALSHANVVAVHDYGVEGGTPFLVMEYVEGVSLRRLLSERRLPPEEALGIVPQLCDALEFAHSMGVVHRDVKPENILVDTRGRVRIADFGLAIMLGLEAPRLTQTDAVMGTPHYMAPEQVESPKTVDHRADIYSMGVVFYEMLTGELPIGHFSMPSQKARVHHRLDEIVLRALAKEPARRYQHASELKKDVADAPRDPRLRSVVKGFEYRSKASLFGWPLVHICFGQDSRGKSVTAKGIIAIGNIAVGVIAIGAAVACGGLAIGGGLGLGLLGIGGGAIGLLLALGGGAVGGVAIGGAAAGYVAMGGGAYGYFAMGGDARGAYVIDWDTSDPEAVKFFSKWRKFLPDTFTRVLEERGINDYAAGMELYQGGAWTRATEKLSNVQENHPHYAQAMQAVGHCFVALKQPDDALAWFHRAHAAQPDSPFIFGDLATAMARTGRTIERIESRDDPYGDGMRAYESQQYEKAFSILSRVSTHPKAMRFVGYNILIREWQRHPEEGIPYLDRAFAAAPADPKVLEDIVRAYRMAGRKTLPNGAPIPPEPK